MKPIIDIKRLEWLITEGESSYSDGRHSFEYELLLDVMARLKVRVDRNAAYSRLKDVYTAKQAKRPKGNLDYQTRYHFPWQIQVTEKMFGSWGKPKLWYPCKTGKEVLERMKWLRMRNEEDVKNDNNDWDEVRMTFHFTPEPRKPLP